MRPLVWWVQDHRGLATVGLLGVAALVVAIVIVASGGSSDAPSPTPTKVVAGEGQAPAGKARGHESSAPRAAHPAAQKAHHAAARRRLEARRRAAAAKRAAADRSSGQSKSSADQAAPGQQPKTKQPSEAGQHSLSQATAGKVAAAHPGASCPKSYSTRQCEEAVQAAAAPAPTVPVEDPSDCTKAMSAAQCEELFAAEEAARAAGSGSILPQECIEHPEQEKCLAVVEQMKAQYEAAHPGG
jgi:hypothetical protein